MSGALKLERRATAILAADAVGYSRAMSLDEELALAALAGSRKRIDGALARHGGRIFNTAGDGILAEFTDPAAAVAAAIEVQAALAAAPAGEPVLPYRIGVHAGHAFVNDGDLLGDDVNIAARLESLAPEGAVCISGAVHDAIAGRLDLPLRRLGRRVLKNIAEPVEAFLIGADADANGIDADEALPRLAVLPLRAGDDRVPRYLCEGIADDLVRALSRFRSLRVLARSSALELADDDPKRIAAKREIDYLIRGTLRSRGKALHLVVHLIEARQGITLWVEDYDLDGGDLLAVEDEVVGRIVAMLVGRIEEARTRDARDKEPARMVGHDFLLQGIFHAHQTSPQSGAAAKAMFERALALDGGAALTLAWHALIRLRLWAWNPVEGGLDAVMEEASRALALDPGEAWCHLVAGQVRMYRGELDQAAVHHKKALSLNPGDAHIIALRSPLSTYMGRPEEGADWARKAMRLNPNFPEWYVSNLGLALYMAHQYSEAVDAYSEASAPQIGILAGLAACHARLGDDAAAREAAARLLHREPRFSVDRFVAMRPFRPALDAGHLRDGLLAAGLPA